MDLGWAAGSTCWKYTQPCYPESSLLKSLVPNYFTASGRIVTKQGLWPSPIYAKSWLIGKDSDAGRDWGQEEKGTTEDEMAGWHHRLDGRESEWTLGVGVGQGGLAFCDSRVTKSRTRLSDWTDWLNLQKFIQVQARLYWDPCYNSGEQKQVTGSLAYSPVLAGGGQHVPCMGWGWGCVHRLEWRGDLGGLPTPLVVLRAGGTCSTLLLLQIPCFHSWFLRSDRIHIFLGGRGSFSILFIIFNPSCTEGFF